MLTTKTEQELLITRIFDAGPELVFKAWTDPGLLTKWYAPDGCRIEYKCIAVKTGGVFHSCIHDPVHGDCWIKGIYREVVYPSRLVFTMKLTDKEGNPVGAAAAGKPEDWPEEILTTVTFTATGEKTRLVLHQTVAEAKAKQTGAYQSWGNMFGRLEVLLKAAAQ